MEGSNVYTIVFALRKNRPTPGDACVVDGDGVVHLGPWECLGCCDSVAAAQHGNASCDPLKPWGNTPTGDYEIQELLNHGALEANIHSYGPYDTLALIGTSGDALTATGGATPLRSGIEAHAGDPGPDGHILRVTHGCIRSSDEDQLAMINFLKANGGITNFLVRVTES
jgi:hypothetical protein